VEAIAQRADNAILVPVEALHETEAGSTWVFVLADGQVRLRQVDVGLMSEAYAAITSGLDAGEVVTTGTVAMQ
jgi:multidrug efflux pump subunit AcrA (membrane-fusion protein)